MFNVIVAFALTMPIGQLSPREPIKSLGVEGSYVTINGRSTFLVGQMSAEFTRGRTLDEIGKVLDVMMVPYEMNLIIGDFGVIYWGAWNNLKNVERKLEKSFRPHQYPWKRTGGGKTTFGGPRFDIDEFDQKYFDVLVQRLELFNKRGMVPVVGIFSEHALNHPLHWKGHPFHPQNNINDLGLPERDALPEYFENKRAMQYQESYVRKLLETIKDVQYILSPFGEVNVAPKAYINHWLRLFEEHERKKGRDILVCLSGRSEVLDMFASDPAVDLINVTYYHRGGYDGPKYNIPEGKLGIRQTLKEAREKYHKPVGKLYFKYGYPYANPKSPWADPVTGTQGGGPKTAARDALWAVYESGGFGIYFKMAWGRDRGIYMKPDSWSEDIRNFWKTIKSKGLKTSQPASCKSSGKH